jgi:hypothetical protein
LVASGVAVRVVVAFSVAAGPELLVDVSVGNAAVDALVLAPELLLDVLLADAPLGGAADVVVACGAMALIDELSSAVGSVMLPLIGLFSADTPLNGAKKSRLKPAWLRFGLNRNGASAFTVQCEHSSMLNPPVTSPF